MVCVTILYIDSYGQKVKLVPVTTSSPKALELYNKAMDYSMDVNIPAFRNSLAEASKEDPQFFMAHYQDAVMAAFLNNEKRFTSSANEAIACKVRLS